MDRISISVAFIVASSTAVHAVPSTGAQNEWTKPDVRQVQHRAVEYARVDIGQVDAMVIRARAAAALPEMRVRPWFYMDRDRKTEVDHEGSRAPQQTDQDDSSLRLEVRATWRLDELVFSPNEPRLLAESVRMTERRERIVTEVTRIYFARRKSLLHIQLHPEMGEKERLESLLRVEEDTAALDAMTGGWFSEVSE